MTSCGGSSSYNGDVQHDAEIIYENIFEDFEDPSDLYREYGGKYGMQKMEEVMDAVEVVRKSKDN